MFPLGKRVVSHLSPYSTQPYELYLQLNYNKLLPGVNKVGNYTL